MEDRELWKILLERLHVELSLFKDTMLRKSKEDIYAGSYMTEMYVNLYYILADEAERMEEPLLRKLVYQPSGILDSLYEEWMNKDDSFYAELRDYVEDKLDALSTGGTDGGKEDDGYGKEQDKAA